MARGWPGGVVNGGLCKHHTAWPSVAHPGPASAARHAASALQPRTGSPRSQSPSGTRCAARWPQTLRPRTPSNGSCIRRGRQARGCAHVKPCRRQAGTLDRRQHACGLRCAARRRPRRSALTPCSSRGALPHHKRSACPRGGGQGVRGASAKGVALNACRITWLLIAVLGVRHSKSPAHDVVPPHDRQRAAALTSGVYGEMQTAILPTVVGSGWVPGVVTHSVHPLPRHRQRCSPERGAGGGAAGRCARLPGCGSAPARRDTPSSFA